MVVDVQLCRAPGQPFGFRLIGGRDFEIPLTVSRVRFGVQLNKQITLALQCHGSDTCHNFHKRFLLSIHFYCA